MLVTVWMYSRQSERNVQRQPQALHGALQLSRQRTPSPCCGQPTLCTMLHLLPLLLSSLYLII
jgi:hypothetical protein